MGCFRMFLAVVRRMDMFPSGELLRYKTQPVYRTLTGGLISIIILTIFATLFASTAIETLNKQIIFSKESIERQADPVSSLVNLSPTDGLMFALAIVSSRGGFLNLSDTTTKAFDVQLNHFKLDRIKGTTVTTSIPLTTCTIEHFSQSEMSKRYYIDGVTENMLCPELNTVVELGGAGVSAQVSWMSLTAKKCDASKYSNCISDQGLQELQAQFGGNFRSYIILMGNMVNSESAQYRQPYPDGRYEFSFSTNLGLDADMYISETIVKTDESISPFPDIVKDKVLSIQDFFIARYVNTEFSNTYMSVRFEKSHVQKTYQRSFQKADQFFSYVGGLIGTIIGLLFVLNFYSRQAYSISIASQLYLSQQGTNISSRAFHLGYFLLIPIKRLLNLISCCPIKWQKTDFYTRCMDEANQQLDVMTLMKKIIFLEKAMSLLFTKHQLESLYLFERQKIDEASKQRKKHELNTKLNYDNNKVAPQETPSDLHSDSSGGPKLNQVLAYPHIMRTDDELSGVSVSQVNLRSQQRIKTHLKTLMKESCRGNNISSQIASYINPKLLASMGLKKEDAIIEDSGSESYQGQGSDINSSEKSGETVRPSKVRFGPSQILESDCVSMGRKFSIVTYDREAETSQGGQNL